MRPPPFNISIPPENLTRWLRQGPDWRVLLEGGEDADDLRRAILYAAPSPYDVWAGLLVAAAANLEVSEADFAVALCRPLVPRVLFEKFDLTSAVRRKAITDAKWYRNLNVWPLLEGPEFLGGPGLIEGRERWDFELFRIAAKVAKWHVRNAASPHRLVGRLAEFRDCVIHNDPWTTYLQLREALSDGWRGTTFAYREDNTFDLVDSA